MAKQSSADICHVFTLRCYSDESRHEERTMKDDNYRESKVCDVIMDVIIAMCIVYLLKVII